MQTIGRLKLQMTAKFYKQEMCEKQLHFLDGWCDTILLYALYMPGCSGATRGYRCCVAAVVVMSPAWQECSPVPLHTM